MSERYAVIDGQTERIRELIERSTMASHSDYEHAYLHVTDEAVNVMSSVTGASSVSYATFGSEYFNTVAVDDNAPDSQVGILIDIDTFVSYFALVDGNKTTRLEFYGDGDGLCNAVEMHGDLDARLRLPTQETILDTMPLWVSDRFDEDNVWTSDEITLETHIETDVSVIDRIIDAVDADDVSQMSNYPIVVTDGKFQIDVVGSNDRNWITGSLNAESVDGPDVGNLYGSGFTTVFNSLSGSVLLQTAPGGNGDGTPLVVIDEEDDVIVRHVLGPVGEVN